MRAIENALENARQINELDLAPAQKLREFIRKHCTTEADEIALQGERRLEAGMLDEAESLFKRVLEEQDQHPTATLGLAEIAFQRDDLDETERLLSRVIPADGVGDKVDRLRSILSFRRQATDFGPLEAARKSYREEPDDPERGYRLAVCLVDAGEYEEALDLLLQIVKKDRSFRDDGARRAIVEVFQVIGVRSALAEEYRKKLSALLF